MTRAAEGGNGAPRGGPAAAPKRPRSLLGKIVVGISLAILLFSAVVMPLMAYVYHQQLVKERRGRLDLVAQILIQKSRADAVAAGTDLLETVERTARRFSDRLDGAVVSVVDHQGLAISLEADARARRAASAATAIVEETGGFAKIKASASRVEDGRLIHLTPIRERTGLFEGALILDAPLAVEDDILRYALLRVAIVPVFLLYIGIATIFVVYRRVLRPVGALTEANRALVEGDAERAFVPAQAIPDDELGAVIDVRNQIYARMLEYQQAIRQKNKVLERQREELGRWAAELERRVAAKTEDLARVHEHLRASEKLAATGSLAAGLAHEINNPLASIAGYAEDLLQLSRRRELRDLGAFREFPESLRIIEEQAYRCQRIISRLMRFARPAPYEPERLQLAPLVEGVLPLVEHKARGRDVALIVDIDPDLPEVFADRSSLEQVLVNLLVNAFDVIEEDTGRITVVAEPRDAGEVLVSVRDTGPGMPEEVRQRVFDPFFSTKPVGHGTGLGLAISHVLVSGMGGRIEVESELGRGTTFTIVLPVAPAGVDGGDGGERGGAAPSPAEGELAAEVDVDTARGAA